MSVIVKVLRTCFDDYMIQSSSSQLTWIDCTASGLKHWKWKLTLGKIYSMSLSIYCTLLGEEQNIQSSTFSWRKQNLWILSKTIKLSFGISQRSSTINVSLHYNIKGNIHPLLSPIIFSLVLSFPLSALCSVVLWRKCQVKLWKTQRGLWCKCIWINTVWNASGIFHHKNSYFTLYL